MRGAGRCTGYRTLAFGALMRAQLSDEVYTVIGDANKEPAFSRADEADHPAATQPKSLKDLKGLARFSGKTCFSVLLDQKETPEYQEPHKTNYLEKFSEERIRTHYVAGETGGHPPYLYPAWFPCRLMRFSL